MGRSIFDLVLGGRRTQTFPSIDRRDRPPIRITPTRIPKLSVGTGKPNRRPKLIPVSGVPKILEPKYNPSLRIPSKAAGPAPAPKQVIVPGMPSTYPPKNPRILTPYPKPVPKPTGVLDQIIDLIKPNDFLKEKPVAIDLGNLLSVGLGYARDVAVARAQPVYDPQGFNPWSNVPLDQRGYIGPGEIAEAPGTGTCLPPGYKFDKCGNVVKVRRRRRRRLATSSDIKDLAALSSVTTGVEKKTWIATHPS